jgi:hypothetical protein
MQMRSGHAGGPETSLIRAKSTALGPASKSAIRTDGTYFERREAITTLYRC